MTANTGVLIARQGGVDSVLAALKRFSASSSPARTKVLQKACWAVLALASCGTCAVVVLHGVAAWMAPCFRHRLVLSSCCCVRGCADSVASHIAAKGGIQSVIASMKSCSTKPDVQQYGAWALANVGWSDPDIKQRAVAAGEHRLPLPPPLHIAGSYPPAVCAFALVHCCRSLVAVIDVRARCVGGVRVRGAEV